MVPKHYSSFSPTTIFTTTTVLIIESLHYIIVSYQTIYKHKILSYITCNMYSVLYNIYNKCRHSFKVLLKHTSYLLSLAPRTLPEPSDARSFFLLWPAWLLVGRAQLRVRSQTGPCKTQVASAEQLTSCSTYQLFRTTSRRPLGRLLTLRWSARALHVN